MTWVGQACQLVHQLIPRLWRSLGILLSVSTLRHGLRQAGYSWKCMRRSLKRQLDPRAFAACQQQLAALHQDEARGEVAVYYADEVRFSRQAPVPYAWQLRGQPPVGLLAERGGGYSVLGFWRPADPHQTGGQAFHSALSSSSFTAELFVLAVDEWLATLEQPTVLVLDNASVHRAGCVQTKQMQWATQGLTLFFLPPYSPELNRIEILWRFCKHYWLPPAAYETALTLLISVTHLLRQIGSSDYQVTFA